MTRDTLIKIIQEKKSFLCIGLDTDLAKIPSFLHGYHDPVFEFNKAIIDHTQDLAVAFKINTAFYENRGIKGWTSLEKTVRYLDQYRSSIFLIADAKRGDIGNTSQMYAGAFLADPPHGLGFDSITVAPYMGNDSVKPFFYHKGKWVILLALTSNAGFEDLQTKRLESGEMLFEYVIRQSMQWGNIDNLMFVIGATRQDMLSKVRQIVPNHFLLVPGVGTQGGSLKAVAQTGLTKDFGLLVNSSRGILYAVDDESFPQAARTEALKIQQEMAIYLQHLL